MKKELLSQVIYQVYVRNYTKEGTFKALLNKLDYIKDLGVDILYVLPIHEIGEKGRKGTLGSPYAIKDYYSVNHELGNLDDFKELIRETHKRGMKIMMDIVFNHTSRDSILIKEHEDFYYHNKDNKLSNKVGDWSDVYDLDYSNNKLEKYLIDNIKYYVGLGIDGFRFDVCSLIPLKFFKSLRKEIKDKPILLGESIELSFIKYMRSINADNCTDSELYECFDLLYPYEIFADMKEYFTKKDLYSFKKLKLKLEQQYYYLPEKAIKINCLENHDQERIASYFQGNGLYSITALSFFNKGTGFIYGGQECKDNHLPSLFDKDDINLKVEDTEFFNFIKSLISFKHQKFNNSIINTTYIQDDEKDTLIAINQYPDFEIIGLFNMSESPKTITSETLKNKEYIDLLTNEKVVISNNSIEIDRPLFLKEVQE